MRLITIIFIFLTALTLTCLSSIAEQSEIIAKINGKDISKQKLDRLLSLQKKRFHSDLNFDLLLPPGKDSKVTERREELLKKARQESIAARAKDFDTLWDELIKKYGSVKNFENIAALKNITIPDLRKKIEENIVLDKLFENQTKEKLIEKLVNEELLLQEAEAQDIKISEEEVIKRLALIKQKKGGDEAFNRFLSENNATIEDATSEVRDQALIEVIKNQMKDLNAFLKAKKSFSEIVVYRSRIFPKEEDNLPKLIIDPTIAKRPVALPPPSPTLENIKELEVETNNILAKEIRREESEIFIPSLKEDLILKPINTTMKPTIDAEPIVPGNPVITESKLSEQNTNETSMTASDIQTNSSDRSKAIQELRRKIEQRRFVSR